MQSTTRKLTWSCTLFAFTLGLASNGCSSSDDGAKSGLGTGGMPGPGGGTGKGGSATGSGGGVSEAGPSGGSNSGTGGGSSGITALGDCSSETALSGRTDIVFCEPWQDADWWQKHGYVRDGSKTDPQPATAEHVGLTTIVSEGCVSGSCLRIAMPKGGTSGLAVHWPLSNAGLKPEHLYLRYYIRLAPDWNPYSCDETGTIVGSGGKFPGLVDVRTSADPSGQCGNGGETADGINCWSMRANYHDCGSGPGTACSSKPGATTRFGSYLYFYRQDQGDGSYTGVTGHWDDDPWNQFTGDGATCKTTANNVYCGVGKDTGAMLNDHWYRMEMFVQMNTPDVADGVIRGWVDGQLGFEKTNMIFRITGHDDLHVRTVWLNVYKGGVIGNCADSAVYLDQMVVATDSQIGSF